MVRALLSQPVGCSVLSAPPPGVVVLVESPPSLLVLALSPPLLLPALELGLAPSDLLLPQPAPTKTDAKARAHVSESTFRNIAIVLKCQLHMLARHIDTCNHMNFRAFVRIFQWDGVSQSCAQDVQYD
jgi:hypothetical protein